MLNHCLAVSNSPSTSCATSWFLRLLLQSRAFDPRRPCFVFHAVLARFHLSLQLFGFWLWKNLLFELSSIHMSIKNSLVQLGEETIVDDELVWRFDFLCLWCSQKQTLLQLAHRQWLKRSNQILFGYVRFLLDFLVCHSVASIEQHQHAHLKRNNWLNIWKSVEMSSVSFTW